MRNLLWISVCCVFATGCTCQRGGESEQPREGTYVTDGQGVYFQEYDSDNDRPTMQESSPDRDSARVDSEASGGMGGSMSASGDSGEGGRVLASPEIGYYQTFEDAQPASPMDTPEAQEKLASLREKAPRYQSNQHNLPDPQALYMANCSRCHGAEGQGDGPEESDLGIAPTNFHDWDLKFGESLENIVYSVTYGQSEEEMPAFKEELTEDQIWSVSILVHQWIQNR